MSKTCTLLLGLLVCTFITACQNPIPQQSTVITDQTCLPPCWNNITPGLTTANEAETILRNADTGDPQSVVREINTIDGWYDTIYWRWQDFSRGYLLLQNDTVWLLSFSENEGRSTETLSQAIEKYGEPEFVFSMLDTNNPRWGEIMFEYPQQGLIFSYVSHDEEEMYRTVLRPETPISIIVYFSPEDYQRFQATFSPPQEWTQKEILGSQYPWNGYGNISDKYPTAYGQE